MEDLENSCASSIPVITTRTEKSSQQLIVQNYSIRKLELDTNESIDSDHFTVGGHSWCIRFFPNGKTLDIYNKGYTSVFLALEDHVDYRVPCLFEIYLLDQSGKGRHEGHDSFNKFPPAISYFTYSEMSGLPLFIKRERLEDLAYYVKDDCLIINCTVHVLVSHIPNPPIVKEVHHPSVVKLLENATHWNTDIVFQVAGETFRAHKQLIFSFTLNFNHLYRDVVIRDIEPRIFKAILWFMYTLTLLEEEEETMHDSCRFICESFTGKMLMAADRFGFKRLQEIYESRISERLSVESVSYLLHLAERSHAAQLKDACLRFADENRAAVMESDGVQYLKETCPSLFLEVASYAEKLSTEALSAKELSTEALSTEKPSTSRERAISFCTKIVSRMKESLDGMFSPYAYNKLKEV